MKTMEVQTTLHCQNCVDKVSPLLDNEAGIKHWEANFDNGVSLTIDGEISKEHLNHLLNQKGYQIKDEKSFWKDWSKWKRASTNTFSCLVGCSIGDFGMVFYLQAFHPSTPMMWQMILAIIAGLCTSIILETILMKARENFGWMDAFKTALGMSFLSMVAMEIAMTSTDFMITGGKAAFDDIWYWLALIPALIVGFLVPLPYNYYKLKKFDKACH
ncbi:DUF4396 domain-containing protein [Ekhidna sp.]|uniref:DUF4396 domain-containing protein n=1 Tax=Ekhidna sp. TaxID=2608089 RepID=UPI003517A8ED